jgi:glycosyltransferase involved in cell wall biosynthesis
MLDETTGLLVPQGDVTALAAAMERLAVDPDRRQAYGRAAAKRAHSFTAPSVLPQFERAYEALIAAGPRRTGR